MSEARLLRPAAVKKLVGLSSAELTLLPVARAFWVVAKSEAVLCNERRFWRTEAERTIPDITVTFLVYTFTRPFRPDYLGTVRASHLTKHELDIGNLDNQLARKAGNATFTAQAANSLP